MKKEKLDFYINKICTITFKNGETKYGRIVKVADMYIINGNYQVKPSEVKKIECEGKCCHKNGKYTIINREKIEDHIYKIEKQLIKTGNICTSYQVHFSAFNNKNIVRSFKTLDEAQQFKMICETNIRKIKFDASLKNSVSEEKIKAIEEYPENLLRQLEITAEEYNNFYNEILPNFGERFNEVCRYLTEREQVVLRKRFQQYKKLEEVGKDLNVTRERVRQIEAKALRKLRHPNLKNVLVKNKDKLELINAQERQELYEKLKREMTLDLARQIIAEYEEAHKEEKKQEKLKEKIEDLDLSIRAYNCLHRAGIKTINELCKLTEKELSKIRSLGKKSELEVIRKLEKNGFKLKEEENEYIKHLLEEK